MNHFDYVNGILHAEGVSVTEIAARVGTPFYCYSTATLTRHYTVFADALKDAGLDATVCFALKANPNVAVVRTLAKLGAGADVVSEGELRQALEAGVPADRIVFSGVGKTQRELEFAVAKGIMQINVESEPELELLSQIAAARGVKMPIALRVNPDVDAGTHAKITTGKKENKFGIEWTRAHEVYKKARELPGVEPVAIACHIGSQLTELEPFAAAFRRVRDLVAMLRADGFAIRRLDLGGGLGVPYENETPPAPADYAQTIKAELGDLGCRIVLEPGRVLVGNAGILVSSVVYVKEGSTRTFAIVDAAMNDLVRPTLYEAFHALRPVVEPPPGTPMLTADVVGPVCESGDYLALDRAMPEPKAGDLIAVMSAGAYGAVQAGTYNTRPLVPEVLVNGADWALVRPRLEVADIIARDQLPEWL